MEQEIWKDIPGYDGLYQVSTLGNVKGNNGKLLRFWIKKRGNYKLVTFSVRGKRKHYQIHRLVAYVFLGLDIDNKNLYVCHIDDNPSNNTLNNIFIGSHQDNMDDMVKKGRQHKGELQWRSRISNETALKIKKMISLGYKPKSIKDILKIDNKFIIYDIKYGRTWKHILINNV